MTNPFIGLLSRDNRSAFLSAFVTVAIFTVIYYFFTRESFVILLLVFIVSGIYIMGFLQGLEAKLKLYLMLPVTTKQLIDGVFMTTLRTIGLLLLFVLPFYLLACSFDEVSVAMDENMMLYVATVGNTLLLISMFIWLFFEMKERNYVTIAQIASLFVITFMTFSIVMTFERIGLHVALQIGIFVMLYGAIIFTAYKRSVYAITKFNIN